MTRMFLYVYAHNLGHLTGLLMKLKHFLVQRFYTHMDLVRYKRNIRWLQI